MIDTTKWPAEAVTEHNRLCGVLDAQQAELRHLKERERDICAAVGGISDGGRYRNDVIEHLKLLTAQAARVDLVSRHREGCPHYHPGGRDIFCLSDEDSYDVCTCLRNFVSTSKFNVAVELLQTISSVGLKDSVEDKINVFLEGLKDDLSPQGPNGPQVPASVVGEVVIPLLKAAEHLALATPDRVLRGVLEQTVRTGWRKLEGLGFKKPKRGEKEP